MRSATPVTQTHDPAPTLEGGDRGEHHFDLIQVFWLDIISDSSWTPPEDVECPIFRTIGWKVYEDESTLKIADTIDEENSPFGVTAFPKGVIVARRMILPAAPRLPKKVGVLLKEKPPIR